MSQVIIEDSGWAAIMADPKLEAARRKLSFHEIRLIVNHARARHPAWPCCSQLVGEAWVDGKHQPEFCPVHSQEGK